MLTACRTASTSIATVSASRRRAAPAPWRTTFGTGHPMFKSMMSAPPSATIRAASATTLGSEPKSWMASGFSSAWLWRSIFVLAVFRTNPSELTISEVTRSTSKLFVILRKLRSVIPAMGARINPCPSSMSPILSFVSVFTSKYFSHQ